MWQESGGPRTVARHANVPNERPWSVQSLTARAALPQYKSELRIGSGPFALDLSWSTLHCTAPSTVCRESAGRRSFGSASGATNSGCTRSSSETVVSRTRSRSAPVRRSRRSRVVGNVLTGKAYALPVERPGQLRLGRLLRRLDLDRDRAATLP